MGFRKIASLRGGTALARARLQASLYYARKRRVARQMAPQVELIFSDDLSDGPGVPIAITTPIAANQVWQRGKSTLTLAGTYDLAGGDPSSMAWRVGSGTWNALTAEAIGSGSWAGTLTIPSDYLAQGVLEVKPVNGMNVTPATVSGLTVTDVYVVNGQSNADGYATNNQTFISTNFNWMVCLNGSSWSSKTSDPTWNSNGSIWPAFAELLDAFGVPPAFVSGATIDGTGYITNDWNPGDGIYDQAVARLNGELARTGGCVAELWWQGERDSSGGSTEAAYFSASVARRNGFDSAITNFDSSVPTYLFQLGEHAGPGLDAVRQALKRLRRGEDPRFRSGPNLLMEDWGDGTHAGTVQGSVSAVEAEAQLDRIAAMLFRSVAQPSHSESPVIVSAAADQVTPAKVLVTFDTAMENHTNPSGWTVTDSGGMVSITSAASGASADQVILTCVRGLYGPVTVGFGLGNQAQAAIADIGTVLREAVAIASIKLPPEYHLAVDAGTGAGVAPVGELSNGTFDTDLTDWTQSGTSWQWRAPGVAACDKNLGAGGALFLRQAAPDLIPGATYNFSIEVTSRTSGAVNVRIRGATNASSSKYTSAGTYTGSLVCPAGPIEFIIIGNSTAILSVGNVTLERA